MAKLEIIIPHYKEDEQLMHPMFDILRLQRNVKWSDFRVLIVCDGEDIILSDEFKKYIDGMPFSVSWINIPHGGISAARNAGLDHSQSDWIMFCDSDDAFLSTTSLMTYLRFMTDDKAAVFSAFFEESPHPNKDGRIVLLWHGGRDYIFIHGKAFRREWLKDNHIRFKDDVYLHEDAYFVALAKYHLNKKDTVYIKDPLYLWQGNPQSVTRRTKNFVLETYDQLCKKNSALIDELLRRGMFVPAKGIVCRTITDAYCRLHAKSWNTPENKELINDAEDCVALFLKHYDYIFKSAGDKVIQVGLDDLRNQMIKVGDFDPDTTIPFDEWVEKLRN